MNYNLVVFFTVLDKFFKAVFIILYYFYFFYLIKLCKLKYYFINHYFIIQLNTSLNTTEN